jgi:hypothetical protein
MINQLLLGVSSNVQSSENDAGRRIASTEA